MKTFYNLISEFFKREWFLLVTVSVIAMIIYLFEIL
jgi:hypothetical protein